MEEWIHAAISLFLHQSNRKPLTILPYVFKPQTEQFAALIRLPSGARARVGPVAAGEIHHVRFGQRTDAQDARLR